MFNKLIVDVLIYDAVTVLLTTSDMYSFWTINVSVTQPSDGHAPSLTIEKRFKAIKLD